MKDRIASWLLKWAKWVSDDTRDWADAMVAEVAQMPPGMERLSWRWGIVALLLRRSVTSLASDRGRRPLELTATALYLVAFSLHVSGHLVLEAASSGIREPWADAWFPLILCFSISAVPALIAIGVWLCDDLARKLTVAFVAFDLAVVIAFAHSLGFTALRTVKFACDVAILAAMLTPRVRQACSWRPAGKGQKVFQF
jgi:hypothetical protein